MENMSILQENHSIYNIIKFRKIDNKIYYVEGYICNFAHPSRPHLVLGFFGLNSSPWGSRKRHDPFDPALEAGYTCRPIRLRLWILWTHPSSWTSRSWSFPDHRRLLTSSSTSSTPRKTIRSTAPPPEEEAASRRSSSSSSRERRPRSSLAMSFTPSGPSDPPLPRPPAAALVAPGPPGAPSIPSWPPSISRYISFGCCSRFFVGCGGTDYDRMILDRFLMDLMSLPCGSYLDDRWRCIYLFPLARS